MPELPEVERGRKVAAAVAEGRTISRVRCANDDIVFDGVTPNRVRKTLEKRTVRAVHRHGKQLWFELDTSPHPLFHFGMTGAFVTPDATTIKLASSPTATDTTWPPRFTKIHLHFDDGGELVMTNKRRLGRIRLQESPPDERPLCDLGFDPLLQMPTPTQFARLISRRTGNIKAVLLDQSFAAGVGNWIADEILYQARIDPRRRVPSLDATETKRIRTELRKIIQTAVGVDAEKTRFPRTWLFHHRWGKVQNARTSRGEPIEHLTIAGRTTAWVPSVQV